MSPDFIYQSMYLSLCTADTVNWF